eukprot:1156294-Pelagomonas_calceolata.AAC.1
MDVCNDEGLERSASLLRGSNFYPLQLQACSHPVHGCGWYQCPVCMLLQNVFLSLERHDEYMELHMFAKPSMPVFSASFCSRSSLH